MQHIKSNANSPALSLLILLGLALVSAFTLQLIVLLGYNALFNNSVSIATTEGQNMLSFGQSSSGFMYAMLATSSIATFLIPAIVLQYIERNTTIRYFPMSARTPAKLYGIAISFLIAFNPVLGLIGEWNMHMELPASWSSIENWMRAKEDEMALLTERMVMNDAPSVLVLNLIMLAVLPAIAEEFFFRGALQNIIGRWIANKHIVIWSTAIIFSAIHIQFFGFVPRMLLGAIFGYMLIMTQTIWIPILAHFVNNATVVLVAFYYTKKGYTYQQLITENPYNEILYFISIIASIAIGWYFYKQSLKQKTETWNQAG